MKTSLAEWQVQDLRGYAGQNVRHVVHTQVLQLVSHTLHLWNVYGLGSTKHHLQQWVGLQPTRWLDVAANMRVCAWGGGGEGVGGCLLHAA